MRTERSGDPLEKGLTQLDAYLERLGLQTGLLVIFDRRGDAPDIAVRTERSEVMSPAGRTIQLLRA